MAASSAGWVYEAGLKLEDEVNRRLETTAATRVHVVFVSTGRDELYRWLVEGRGDVIAAGLPVTPSRARLVDFTVPTHFGINQILATGPSAPPIRTLDHLAGAEVAVREGSIEREGLVALNEIFARQGSPLVVISSLPRSLEDEDLLEMVHAGLLPATVIDEFTGRFWSQILPQFSLHEGIVVRPNIAMAWAVRKGSPELPAALNPIIEANRVGTVFGNTLLTKYLRLAKVVGHATSDKELSKFRSLTGVFKKYSDRYGLDYLLMMAQGFQESRLNQHANSRVGAVGIMQVMPATGRQMNVGDIHQLESNVDAGIKYLRAIIDRHFPEGALDPVNKTLFAFAAYNCGPARLRRLRQETASRGLDPNQWFNHVERIVGESTGRQTVEYVSNIYKYYVAYKLAVDRTL
jgi:membrane-bound lytic murein transglycosylase MltF